MIHFQMLPGRMVPCTLRGGGMVMEIAEAGIDEIQVTEVPGGLTAAVAELKRASRWSERFTFFVD